MRRRRPLPPTLCFLCVYCFGCLPNASASCSPLPPAQCCFSIKCFVGRGAARREADAQGGQAQAAGRESRQQGSAHGGREEDGAVSNDGKQQQQVRAGGARRYGSAIHPEEGLQREAAKTGCTAGPGAWGQKSGAKKRHPLDQRERGFQGAGMHGPRGCWQGWPTARKLPRLVWSRPAGPASEPL